MMEEIQTQRKKSHSYFCMSVFHEVFLGIQEWAKVPACSSQFATDPFQL